MCQFVSVCLCMCEYVCVSECVYVFAHVCEREGVNELENASMRLCEGLCSPFWPLMPKIQMFFPTGSSYVSGGKIPEKALLLPLASKKYPLLSRCQATCIPMGCGPASTDQYRKYGTYYPLSTA